MSRRVLSAFVVLFAMVGLVAAAEIKGKVTKVDAENHKITVSVDGKDQEVVVTKDTKFISAKGNEMKNGLKSKAFSKKSLERGLEATIKTEKKGETEVATEVKLAGGKKSKD